MTDAKEIFADPQVASFKIRYESGKNNLVRNHVRCDWCGGFGFDCNEAQDIDVCGECKGSGFVMTETRWEEDQ